MLSEVGRFEQKHGANLEEVLGCGSPFTPLKARWPSVIRREQQARPRLSAAVEVHYPGRMGHWAALGQIERIGGVVVSRSFVSVFKGCGAVLAYPLA